MEILKHVARAAWIVENVCSRRPKIICPAIANATNVGMSTIKKCNKSEAITEIVLVTTSRRGCHLSDVKQRVMNKMCEPAMKMRKVCMFTPMASAVSAKSNAFAWVGDAMYLSRLSTTLWRQVVEINMIATLTQPAAMEAHVTRFTKDSCAHGFLAKTSLHNSRMIMPVDTMSVTTNKTSKTMFIVFLNVVNPKPMKVSVEKMPPPREKKNVVVTVCKRGTSIW
mmetsp:Transcript_82297/g.251512  ORF Transcript_82297/g.251512 Transcript_82297/m.251512 type:complete len:224 (-) Transcript_82297:1111-1782(-)